MKIDCNILHLEDDDNDVLFFERVLTQLKFTGQYRRISAVDEAISYLAGKGDFADRTVYPLPTVLIMDSALDAGKTSNDLTKWLDEQKQFRSLPRIVLAGDMSQAAREQWHTRGVTCVLSKGTKLEDLTLSIKEILKQCGYL